MTTPNVAHWLLKNRDLIKGQVLEVGSKHYGEHSLDLRNTVLRKAGSETVTGVDISSGRNVDVVADLATLEFEADLGHLPNFDTILCLSVLEHVPKVWVMASNLERLLRPGGAIFISVPFAFRLHEYPVDCWRFSHQGIVNLFPNVDFLEYSRSEALAADGSSRFSLKNGRHEKLNRFLSALSSTDRKLARKSQKAQGGQVEPYLIQPTILNLVGIRRSTES
jgi:SAM-dependent methyltransferase